jgi:hypothetical protein
MAISAEAQRNHDALFPDHQSTLKATDPELIEIFDNWAFGELLTFSMLASLGGCEPQLAAHVAANVSMGNDRQILVSTITQLLPFIGYPRTLNALRVINESTSA